MLMLIGLCNMLKRLLSRVFRVEADADFQAAFMDYYNRRNKFSPDAMALADWSSMAQKNVHFVLETVIMIVDQLASHRARR